jgi:ataxia telangiectasia mutated family protein
LTFFIDKYHDQLHSEAQRDLRRALLDLLDEEDPNLQSWALIAFSHLATIGDEPVATAIHSANGFAGSQVTSQTSDVQTPWTRVWAHATRKIATAALSRAACHTATCLLKAGLASTPKHISDIRTVLANIEIQGPPFPYDSICSFLCAAVTIARNDATLYQQKLEDRVLGWLLKWSVVDGAKGKTRIDQYSAADVYRLLCEVSGVTPLAMSDLEAEEVLPDCAIVDRLIEEHDTKPLRRLIIHAEFPSKTATSSTMADAKAGPAITLVSSAPNSIEGVQGRPGQVITFLTHSIESLSTDWPTAYDTALAPPERVRKALDLLVAASAYLVTLQSSGSHFDPTCIQAIIHLLAKIKPSLASSSHTIPGQHLMWAAFKPLSIVPSHRPAVWPILLNASPELSGIRKVLFGEDANNDKLEGDEESAIELQKLTWSEATVSQHIVFYLNIY